MMVIKDTIDQDKILKKLRNYHEGWWVLHLYRSKKRCGCEECSKEKREMEAVSLVH